MLYLPADDLIELMSSLLVLADSASLSSNCAPDTNLERGRNGKIIAVRQTVSIRTVEPAPTMRPGDCPPPPAPSVRTINGVQVWEPWR